MAPLHENVYARGRIVSLQKKREERGGPYVEFAYVHFIDEGFTAWMRVDCLGAMEKFFYSHPWQAIPIALFKMCPGQDLSDLEYNESWPDSVTSVLMKILGEYEYFRVVPVEQCKKTNTYYEYARAEIFGLRSEEDEDGESIGHRLALEMNTFPKRSRHLISDFFQRAAYDAQELGLMVPLSEGLKDAVIAEIPTWRMHFPEAFDDGIKRVAVKQDEAKVDVFATEDGDKVDSTLIYDLDWDPDIPEGTYPTIPCITDAVLCKEGYYEAGTKNCRLCVEWESVKTPYEFFAFPLEKDENMDDLYQKQQKWASVLDSFYSHPGNRKTINWRIVKKAWRNHRSVFAICECNDEVTSGSYRRVQVMAIRNPKAPDYSNEFCRIRFTDVGGKDIVPLAGLLAIHSIHCQMHPLCLQLSVFRISPPDNEHVWPESSSRMFRRLARSDVPIVCSVAGQVAGTSISGYDDQPQKWADVMNVEKLRIFGKEKTVEEQMCFEGLACEIAEIISIDT
uniref:Tudor domain-containing protein n=1 Tax=Ditylenchus dipsaci TaxID=166011 RepID=A0A915E4R6_9BILA